MQIEIFRDINQSILRNSKRKKEKEPTCFIPERCEDYVVPEFKVPNNRQTKKLRQHLSKVLSFIDLNKQRRYSDCCTIMPIPTTESRLISIYGNQREVSRGILFMKELGLISEHDNHYQYNAYYDSDNCSKRYKYFIENEIKVKEYCSTNNIYLEKERSKKIEEYRTIADNFVFDSFEQSAVRFGKVHLLKPNNYSISEFEECVDAIIHVNYPDLQYYQDLADYINEVYYEDYPDFRISYKVNFKWNKGNKAITNISIRATNPLVAAKKKKDDLANELNFRYRDDIRNQYHFDLEKDVKSSVPRITMSLNYGYWITEDTDIYYLVYSEVVRKVGSIEQQQTTSFFDSLREDFKALHLRTYFDSPATLGRNTCHAMGSFSEKSEVYEAMSTYRQALEAIEGPLFDVEIFYHESNIYMEVLKQLLDDEYFVWQVYDSWYARKDGVTQEEYQEYVSNIIESKANDYIGRIQI